MHMHVPSAPPAPGCTRLSVTVDTTPGCTPNCTRMRAACLVDSLRRSDSEPVMVPSSGARGGAPASSAPGPLAASALGT